MPVQQQPMAPMPFYAAPDRFPTPVWQADPSQGWPQGQFIQQIPATAQPIETYQQYPNGIYQTTYQQPAFEANTFYTGAVQVLSNPRPPSTPNQQVQLAPPRPNSNYSHTPSPSPAQQQQQQQQQQVSNNRQYQEYTIQQQQQQQSNQQQQNFIQPPVTPTANESSQTGSNSRPGSVNNIINPPTPNQNFNQQPSQQHQQSQVQQSQQPPPQQQQNNTVFTTISNFSPNSSANYVNANSGNAQPGYPQVNNSSPQLVSHNSSGYPGQEQYGGQNHQWQNEGHIIWEQQQVKMEPNYDHQQEQQNNQYMQQDTNVNNSPSKMDHMHNEVQSVKTFSQADKVNLNTRIKTMILNKQQENKIDESKSVEQNPTGHFLWYSHHHHLTKPLSVDGGSQNLKLDLDAKTKQQLPNQNLEQTQKGIQGCRYKNISQNCYQTEYEGNIRNLNNPRNRSNSDSPNQLYTNKETMLKQSVISPSSIKNILNNRELYHVSEFAQNVKVENSDNEYNMCHNVHIKQENDYKRLADRYSTTQEYKNHIVVSDSKKFPPISNSYSHQNRLSQNLTNANGMSYPVKYEQTAIPKNSFSEALNDQIPQISSNVNGLVLLDANVQGRRNPYNSLDLNSNMHRQLIPQKFTDPNGFKKHYGSVETIRDQNLLPIANSRTLTPEHKNYSNQLLDNSPSVNSSQRIWSYMKNELKHKIPPEIVNSGSSPDLKTKNASLSYKKSPTTNRSPLNQVPNFKLKENHVSPVSMLRSKDILNNKQVGMEIPKCNCFPPDQAPPEPGTYYTHLGCANSLKSLRYDLECRTGVKGDAIRIEKIRYTGKEGKTAQGCPIAKWVIRRQNIEEKYLVIVKHRNGHLCHSTFIVVCLVVWDGVEQGNADELYSLLTNKLNKFGIPTKRRCATNEPRTCACQGISEDTCGASFSFGCSWSMYYNGCKFARSKDVRKFRLSEKDEELEVEEKLQNLANYLSPMYRCLAPISFKNQCHFENIASDCRLGHIPGRPFSGVTACMDFCAHAHKDLHNMINGCTVVVTLTKHRSLSKPTDEQLHVLPLYVAEDTDEFGSKENQENKASNGSIEVFQKYPSEVRTCATPAETCLRRNRKNPEGKRAKRKISTSQSSSPTTSTTFPMTPKEQHSNNYEIQNGQISSTVLDYPNKTTWRYDNFSDNSNNSNSSLYSNRYESFMNSNGSYPSSPNPIPKLPQFSFFKTPFLPNSNPFSNHYSQNGFLRNNYYSPTLQYQNYYYNPSISSHTPHLSNYSQFSNSPSYNISNPFDDLYSNNALPPSEFSIYQPKDSKQKLVDITYTDNAECFRDPEIGGVAIALQHGSVLFECAKHELHATTALKQPNRLSPTRISLVFYQHRSLNKAQHGLDEYTEKMKRKLEVNNSQSDLEKSETTDFESKLESSFGSLKDNPGDILLRASTLPTVSLTTMFPMYPCIVTGPFQEQLSCTLGEKP